jgi:hypothetical protein
MLFGYLTLFTALIISLSAAVYSILGLTAIFAAAFWPIVIMGGSLEVGKIVTTLWLHKYWDRAEIQYKLYLCSAVAILMLLTSMGVFGFLSKAHSDQSLVSGDVGAKIAIYDEKIKISRENIDANRKALKQMDEAVDQVMGRSTDEKGADKAVAIRRGQATERNRLLKEIEAEQKKITALNEERAPIAAENRKVEAEVGPIKYIAALVYGDNPDANVLEKSVRWVIILIVIVFDPLALTLLLAATKALEWERGINIFSSKKRDEEEEEIKLVEPTDNPVTEDYADSLEPIFDREEIPMDEEVESVKENNDLPSTPVLTKEPEVLVEPPTVVVANSEYIEVNGKRMHHKAFDDASFDAFHAIERHNATQDTPQPIPGLQLEADNVPNASNAVTGFGPQFPENPKKGDMFLRTDRLPPALFKYNASTWIEVDKDSSTSYAYNDAYIDYLIDKIGAGEYEEDLLSEAERDRIVQRLKEITPTQ